MLVIMIQMFAVSVFNLNWKNNKQFNPFTQNLIVWLGQPASNIQIKFFGSPVHLWCSVSLLAFVGEKSMCVQVFGLSVQEAR